MILFDPCLLRLDAFFCYTYILILSAVDFGAEWKQTNTVASFSQLSPQAHHDDCLLCSGISSLLQSKAIFQVGDRLKHVHNNWAVLKRLADERKQCLLNAVDYYQVGFPSRAHS